MTLKQPEYRTMRLRSFEFQLYHTYVHGHVLCVLKNVNITAFSLL